MSLTTAMARQSSSNPASSSGSLISSAFMPVLAAGGIAPKHRLGIVSPIPVTGVERFAGEARPQRSHEVRRKIRLGVFTTYVHHRAGGAIYAERAFALFLGALRAHCERVVLYGRLSHAGGPARYPIGEGVELIALPSYPELSRPLEALPALLRSLRTFWRTVPSLDLVWVLGPHPLAIAFALLARLRGKPVVLGVRQDLPLYVRSRHPDRRRLHLAASALERTFRLLGRCLPVVAVGPELARSYGRSRDVLEINVSLVSEADVLAPSAAEARFYDGELQILAVGRVEAEKNPLLLADLLALLNADRPRWRLVVCGEGAMMEALASRLAELDLADRAELRGYVSFGEELTAAYRESHMLLHNSSTEGLPQVLLEAMAAALPVVASDVGGIREAVGAATLMVPPRDPAAAAEALRRLAADSLLRADLVEAGHSYVTGRTIEAETMQAGRFLARFASARSA